VIWGNREAEYFYTLELTAILSDLPSGRTMDYILSNCLRMQDLKPQANRFPANSKSHLTYQVRLSKNHAPLDTMLASMVKSSPERFSGDHRCSPTLRPDELSVLFDRFEPHSFLE
jgi:hypothetical protein